MTPRNNKRRIIRVDGTSNCLHQLSIHFRKLSSEWFTRQCSPSLGSQDYDVQPRLRTVYHHKHSDDFTRPKISSQMFICLELLRASVRAQCRITRSSISGPIGLQLLNGRICSDFEITRISPLIVGHPFTLPTRVKTQYSANLNSFAVKQHD